MTKITKILKFGGSSVGSAERIKNVCKIIVNSNKKDRVGVVVSAMQGVTDKLLTLDFDWVKEKHLTSAKELKVPAPSHLLSELENIIKGVKLIGDASPMVMDLIASFGERLSATLIASYLNKKYPAVFVDSRELVKTDNNFQNAVVDFPGTNRNIKKAFSQSRPAGRQGVIPIITGFIGSTHENKTTTIGRGGSDYSASIFGAALGVNVVEIWTDADGVMSADPRIVPMAITLPQISYEEAFEMAYFGAKVLHPATMVPAIKKNIPVLVKNTFNPNHPGTLIVKQSGDKRPVKNISALDGITLLNIGGANLADATGTMERVFKAVANEKVNVILVAQASSKHTICLAVNKNDTEKATLAIKREFEREIHSNKVAIELENDQAIVAVVGDHMRGVPGIAGKIFSTLGDNQINVAAIAQGGSERNVSLVINQKNKNSAIEYLHRKFFSPVQNKIGVFLLGTGNVGGELLKQLDEKIMTNDLGMMVGGVADVNKMFFDENGVDLKRWKKAMKQSPDKMDLNQFLERIRRWNCRTKILVDCTASEKVAKKYRDFVLAGCDIVTPNKKANVLPISKYQNLRKTLEKHGKQFHYDANVGAGLPIIETVKKLTAGGDQIKKIEGIFSGTLSYLFNNYDGRKKFSDLVKEAQEKGYTEPDPREDLSGQDVGRKLLVLAREMGRLVEFSNVKLENLVKSDNYFANRIQKAKSKKCVLRYIGTVTNGTISASLKEIPINHPLANTSGTDNIVAIYSKNYKNPIVIKGAGAGAAVTAASVLHGILKIIQRHGE